MSDLTKSEQARLIALEAIIQKGQETFIEVGHALLEIRKNKLYRQKAETFDEYCRLTFGWGNRRAYQICAAVGVWAKAPEGSKPANERQARPIQNVNHGSHSTTMDEALTQKTARRSSFDQDQKPRDNSGAYLSNPSVTFHVEPEPAESESESLDKHRATKEQVALSKELGGYPKMISVLVATEEEETVFRQCAERVFEQRSEPRIFNVTVKVTCASITIQSLPPPGKIVSRCITGLCRTYKQAKGEKLTPSGAGIGQLSKLIESRGWDSVDEIVETFAIACKSNGFWANNSKDIAMFVRHYDNLRSENASPKKQTIIDRQKEAGGLKGQAYANSVRTVGS